MGSPTFAEYSIISYSISHLSQTEKVKFYYALKGRGKSKGIIQQYNIRQLAKGALLVPKSSVAKTKEFLKFWKADATEQVVFLKNEGSAKKS